MIETQHSCECPVGLSSGETLRIFTLFYPRNQLIMNTNGEVVEWLMAHDWKSCIRLKPYRGFKSLSLRQTQKPSGKKLSFIKNQTFLMNDWTFNLVIF